MADTRPDQPSGDQTPDNPDNTTQVTFERIVSTITLFILAATMGGVFWYACEARKQNKLTRQSIESGSRAYLRVIVDMPQPITTVLRGDMGGRQNFDVGGPAITTISIPFRVPNIGKLPANADIKSIVKYNGQKLRVAPDWTGSKQEHRFIWPSEIGIVLKAIGAEDLTAGVLDDIRSGVGFVYFRVEIVYGDGAYITKVCEEYPIIAAAPKTANGSVGTLGDPSLCPGKERTNDAN